MFDNRYPSRADVSPYSRRRRRRAFDFPPARYVFRSQALKNRLQDQPQFGLYQNHHTCQIRRGRRFGPHPTANQTPDGVTGIGTDTSADRQSKKRPKTSIPLSPLRIHTSAGWLVGQKRYQNNTTSNMTNLEVVSLRNAGVGLCCILDGII